LAATLLATAAGFWACGRVLEDRPGEDPSEVVIDEVAGQWLALLFPSAGFWLMGLDSWHFPYPGWVAAFVFFRLFEEAKTEKGKELAKEQWEKIRPELVKLTGLKDGEDPVKLLGVPKIFQP
ncbi:MAG: phosphatidylglycerophosphatase A, partial [Desulfobacterales bacterium]|nr:phosphatidylglycerophosphatase A [Desulfobacterales bacterium]